MHRPDSPVEEEDEGQLEGPRWIPEESSSYFICDGSRLTCNGVPPGSVANAMFCSQQHCDGVSEGTHMWEVSVLEASDSVYVGLSTHRDFHPGWRLHGLMYGKHLTDGGCVLRERFGEAIKPGDTVGVLVEFSATTSPTKHSTYVASITAKSPAASLSGNLPSSSSTSVASGSTPAAATAAAAAASAAPPNNCCSDGDEPSQAAVTEGLLRMCSNSVVIPNKYLRVYFIHNKKPLGLAFDLANIPGQPAVLHPVASICGDARLSITKVADEDIPPPCRRVASSSPEVSGHWKLVQVREGDEIVPDTLAWPEFPLDVVKKRDGFHIRVRVLDNIQALICPKEDIQENDLKKWEVKISVPEDLTGPPELIAAETKIRDIITNLHEVLHPDANCVILNDLKTQLVFERCINSHVDPVVRNPLH